MLEADDSVRAVSLPSCNWPIYTSYDRQKSADSVEKSALISTVEKYALEIEIFTLSRGFPAQISRSGAQKTHFQRSVCGRSGRTDFFNKIGQKQPLGSAAREAGPIHHGSLFQFF